LADESVLSVRLLDTPCELARYRAAWDELAAEALEPNVFYEPWMLLPALEAFGGGVGQPLLFALVLAGDPLAPPERARLCGFCPLQRRRLHPRLPLSILGLWQHVHCYLCTPLLRANCAGTALAALLDRLYADSPGASLVEFNQILTAGPFSGCLQECCQQREDPTTVLDSHERALFRPRSDGEQYLRSALPGKRRRALERKERRLAEIAPIGYVALERGGDIERWTEEFLQLEAAGWKGESGTALACDAKDSQYFRAIVRAAFERDRLVFCALRLAGRPIAFRCSFLAGDGAFAFKMTYDEQYGDCSPGVLLEMEYVRRLHHLPGLRWMDSCTAADNFMMNQLWPCRRAVQTVLAATGPGPARSLVGLYPWLRALKRTLTRSTKHAPSRVSSQEEMPRREPACCP
jgi:hypothetical protein